MGKFHLLKLQIANRIIYLTIENDKCQHRVCLQPFSRNSKEANAVIIRSSAFASNKTPKAFRLRAARKYVIIY